MAEKSKSVVVKQPIEPIPTEILAENIATISQSIKTLRAGRLKEKTLLLLISHSSGIAQRDVLAVLQAIEMLEVDYCKPKRVSP